MAILSGNRKILSSYFLLLNLSSMVKFSHNKAVFQLAMISLILLSLIFAKLFIMMLAVSLLICPGQETPYYVQ